MAGNVDPIFPKIPKVQWSDVITNANTNRDGTGGANVCFVAGSDGARIDQINVVSLGTNVPTVVRLFVNNGSNQEVLGNNVLVYEFSLPSTTLSESVALPYRDLVEPRGSYEWGVPIPFLPPGYKILASIGTSIGAGIYVVVFGGDY